MSGKNWIALNSEGKALYFNKKSEQISECVPNKYRNEKSFISESILEKKIYEATNRKCDYFNAILLHPSEMKIKG